MSDQKKEVTLTSVQYVNNFLASSHVGQYIISSNAKFVLYGLARWTYYPGEGFPETKSIADFLGISQSSVKRGIYELESLELIKIEKRKGHSNRYILTIPKIPDREIYGKKGDNFCE